MQGTTNPKYPV